MLKTFKRLFQYKRYCVFCGTELVEWVDKANHNGYIEERKWTGCPIFRNRVGNMSDWNNHQAFWTLNKRTPLFDPYTGKKRDDNSTP